MKDSWRAHVNRAGNRTRPCADSMDESTQIRLLERRAMIANDLVTNGFVVTHSMRQMSFFAHIDVVTPIKLVPSSPSASNLNDLRMALQQGIRERRQVLRETHDHSSTIAHRTTPEVAT